MTAIQSGDMTPDGSPMLSPAPGPHRLPRAPIEAGIDACLDRLTLIETAIVAACESAAERTPRNGRIARADWDGDAWRRYLDEAAIQSARYAAEIATLRRRAVHLGRLLNMTSEPPA